MHYVLGYLQGLLLREKTPDLGYMVLSDFNELKRTDFFRSQEYLHGQSIRDICLSDPNAIKVALALPPGAIASLDGSLAVGISRGDQVRREAFRQLKFLAPALLISQDYNYVSTLERGLVLNAVLSVKILLRHVLQEVNTTAYARYIMLDLPCILSQKKLNINEYFERSHAELLDREKEGFCNMESPFDADLLPVFSDQAREYLRLGKFRNFHDFENELAAQIVQRDALKGPERERNIEVEHHFIDFQELQIGEKLRKRGLAIEKRLRFDDLYYARLLASNPENREFFLKETAQKLIDLQYIRAKKVFVALFACYCIGFCLPFVLIVFAEDPGLHLAMGRICLVS